MSIYNISNCYAIKLYLQFYLFVKLQIQSQYIKYLANTVFIKTY
jgi:hypothetical protein